MTPEEYQRIHECFTQLCQLEAPERQLALNRLRLQDPELHQAVEVLLRMDSASDDRLRSVAEKTLRANDAGGHVVVSAMDRAAEGREVRYQLTRLHATGGMGRVWLARDNSIGRNVALKELRPETPVADAVWNRFLNEAKVTGQLEHPGIVPVYEVDSDDAERLFYTMRFVKGQTLHEAIRAFTKRRSEGHYDPMELRELLTALIGVANAVGYAHSRGVLHRDLKGQNVVLGDYGEVIVLDWGLACVIGADDVPADQLPVSGSGITDQTNAGQIIGTPSYMSPEQALSQRDSMTAQTDVFGLGAILYEILTGRAPYQGNTVVATLAEAQAANAPPPSSLWPEAPRALEAICRKAMAQQPSDPYASALDVARELQRWQADESVLAFPDSLPVRLGRWVRRHRTLAATTAGLALIALMALTITTALISSEQKKTAAAHARAEANLQQARDAVQRMLTDVGDERLKNIPQMEKLRESLLQDALEFNQGFLLDSDDPEIRREAGLAYGRLAWIYMKLGKSGEALASWRQGIEILTDLHESAPTDLTYIRTLASSLLLTADTQERLGLASETEATCRTALALLEPLAKGSVADDAVLVTIASCQRMMGVTRMTAGENAEAEMWFGKASRSWKQMSEERQQTPQVLQEQSNHQANLGRLYAITGRTAEARDQFNEMLRSTSALITQEPENHEFRELLASAHQWLSDIERATGNRVVCRREAMEALKIREDLARDFPHIADYQYTVANACGSIAISFAEAGDFKEAEKFFTRGAIEGRKLASTFPAIPLYRHQAAMAVRVAGVFLLNTRRLDEARVELLDAISRFEALASEFPENPLYRMDLAIALDPLARIGQMQQSPAEGRRVAERAISIYEGLIAEKTDVVKVRHKLAQDYRLLGELAASEKDPVRAEEFLRKALAAHRQTANDVPAVHEHHRWVAVGLEKLAEFLLTAGRPDEALPAAEEAVTIRRRLATEQPGWFNNQEELPGSLRLEGRVQVALQNMQAAVTVCQSAVELGADLVRQHSGNPSLHDEYGNSLEQLARTLESDGKLSESITALDLASEVRREAFRLFPDEARSLNQLRANLAMAAELHMTAENDQKATLQLKEMLALPQSSDSAILLRSATLLTRCMQRPAVAEAAAGEAVNQQPESTKEPTIAELAVNQLRLAVEAGLPNAAEVIASETFRPLQQLEAWKTVVEAANR